MIQESPSLALTAGEQRGIMQAALAHDRQGGQLFQRLYQQYATQAQEFKQQHGHLLGWTPDHGGSLFRELRQIDLRSRQEKLEVLKAHGVEFHRLSAGEHAAIYRAGLDAIAEGQTPNVSEGLRVIASTKRNPEKWRATVQRRDVTKLNASALQANEGHAVMQTIGANDADHKNMHHGTIARSLRAVRKQFSLAQRLARLEQETAAQAQRLTIIEGGGHWHDIARSMRAQGAGPTAIAKATGQNLNTVKQFLKRSR